MTHTVVVIFVGGPKDGAEEPVRLEPDGRMPTLLRFVQFLPAAVLLSDVKARANRPVSQYRWIPTERRYHYVGQCKAGDIHAR